MITKCQSRSSDRLSSPDACRKLAENPGPGHDATPAPASEVFLPESEVLTVPFDDDVQVRARQHLGPLWHQTYI